MIQKKQIECWHRVRCQAFDKLAKMTMTFKTFPRLLDYTVQKRNKTNFAVYSIRFTSARGEFDESNVYYYRAALVHYWHVLDTFRMFIASISTVFNILFHTHCKWFMEFVNSKRIQSPWKLNAPLKCVLFAVYIYIAGAPFDLSQRL